MSERTWRLVISGSRSGDISSDVQADIGDILDLMPAISHLVVEIGPDRIVAMRDWPCERMARVDDLFRKIASSDDITAVSAEREPSTLSFKVPPRTAKSLPWQRFRGWRRS